MAHPNNFIITKTYDFDNNKEIILEDLFNDTNYLEKISAISFEKLKLQLPEIEETMIKKGTKAIANNFQNFALTENSLIIHFSSYQVAPYVNGSQKVEINFFEIKEILKKQYQDRVLSN